MLSEEISDEENMKAVGELWKLVYGESKKQNDAFFDISGWMSSFTHQALPAEHMREWVDQTVTLFVYIQVNGSQFFCLVVGEPYLRQFCCIRA